MRKIKSKVEEPKLALAPEPTTEKEIQWVNSLLTADKLPEGPMGTLVKRLRSEMSVHQTALQKLQQAEQAGLQARAEIEQVNGSTKSLVAVLVELKREQESKKPTAL